VVLAAELLPARLVVEPVGDLDQLLLGADLEVGGRPAPAADVEELGDLVEGEAEALGGLDDAQSSARPYAPR
jgi:hypothetical protein